MTVTTHRPLRMSIRCLGRAALWSGVATAVVLGTGACSVSVGKTTPIGKPVSVSLGGPGSVARNDVERGIAEQLGAVAHQQPKKVDCPGDLPARHGATVRCVLTANDDSTVGVTATVTRVGKPDDASSVDYNIEADAQMTPAPHG